MIQIGREIGGDTMETEGPTSEDHPWTNRYMGKGLGGQGGANGRGTRQQKQANEVGFRGER